MVSLGICFLLAPAVSGVSAQNLQDAFGSTEGNSAPGGIGRGESPLQEAARGAGYDIQDGENQLDSTVAAVIMAVLSLLGVVFLILIIYGGILWMTAAGNEDQVGKARKVLTAATIGLIIVFSAYAISYFVIEALTEGTLEGSGGTVGESGAE